MVLCCADLLPLIGGFIGLFLVLQDGVANASEDNSTVPSQFLVVQVLVVETVKVEKVEIGRSSDTSLSFRQRSSCDPGAGSPRSDKQLDSVCGGVLGQLVHCPSRHHEH